jgi:hypothetical protein
MTVFPMLKDRVHLSIKNRHNLYMYLMRYHSNMINNQGLSAHILHKN